MISSGTKCNENIQINDVQSTDISDIRKHDHTYNHITDKKRNKAQKLLGYAICNGNDDVSK